MHKTILILLIIIIALLIILLGRKPAKRELYGKEKQKNREKSGKQQESSKTPTFCLLCGAELLPGSPMRTTLYPEDKKGGRLMEFHGCDSCISPKGSKSRRCPVCQSKIMDGEVIIARRYEKPGKNQVNVLGCPRCYKPSGY
ncbi:MAG: hypothetical protein JEY99_01835 [Spirochaetales bacterium]|nr:hypothetical protein [Spirochaetales bacterium]